MNTSSNVSRQHLMMLRALRALVLLRIKVAVAELACGPLDSGEDSCHSKNRVPSQKQMLTERKAVVQQTIVSTQKKVESRTTDDSKADVPLLGSAEFYDMLLLNDDKEREHRLRRWTAGNHSVMHLVEEHDKAFQWWVRAVHAALEDEPKREHAAPSRRLLVHVDSHLDIGIETWSPGLLDDGFCPDSREEVAQFMFDIMSIGSFVSVGVMSGLVSDMIWIRSRFHNCWYNGPGLGKYTVGFFVLDGTVCQKIISQDSHSESTERDELAGIRTGNFDTCRSDLGTELHDDDKPITTFHLTVTTAEDFERDAEFALQGISNSAEWILDVDEDFFACYSPGRHFAAQCMRHLSPRHRELTRRILYEVGASCDVSTSQTGFELLRLLANVPEHKTGEEWIDWEAEDGPACRLSHSLKKMLVSLSKELTIQQRRYWKQAWDGQHHQNDMFFMSDPQTAFSKKGLMPEHIPDKEELQNALKSFGTVVSHLHTRMGLPLVMTVCRSILNGFLPKGVWPTIESGVEEHVSRALQDSKVMLVEDEENPAKDVYKH
eukprot:gnl/TRDRNA2_/TRDRNA2_173247_c0_seq2.p1 gnl/TRDRNA2_/TRDRNA2_173247_c0~~gnl/TRDRNA2_/TRDRNA2_173247_c0_seq2.p1  ORF type:complete len:547 (+),score=78.55 gnl/TRDRNA2_/TRDRNA2_173247_c0_seq2:3-1643(+)